MAQNKTAFTNLPSLVRDGSNGEATITTSILVVDEPIRAVNQSGAGGDLTFRFSSSQNLLDTYAPRGRYDSIFVVFSQQSNEKVSTI